MSDAPIVLNSTLMLIKEGVATFILYSVVAIFAQNMIFSRGVGVSRMLKLVEDPTVNTFVFGGLICVIQVVAGIISFFVNRLVAVKLGDFRIFITPAIMVGCIILVYIVMFFGIAFCYKKNNAKDVLAALPFATFNCCVLGTLLLTNTKNYTLLQTIAFSIGTAVGYILATILVSEGQRTLTGRNIPQAFKGFPATLVYIGVLALAIYGFTGHMPSY